MFTEKEKINFAFLIVCVPLLVSFCGAVHDHSADTMLKWSVGRGRQSKKGRGLIRARRKTGSGCGRREEKRRRGRAEGTEGCRKEVGETVSRRAKLKRAGDGWCQVEGRSSSERGREKECVCISSIMLRQSMVEHNVKMQITGRKKEIYCVYYAIQGKKASWNTTFKRWNRKEKKEIFQLIWCYEKSSWNYARCKMREGECMECQNTAK